MGGKEMLTINPISGSEEIHLHPFAERHVPGTGLSFIAANSSWKEELIDRVRAGAHAGRVTYKDTEGRGSQPGFKGGIAVVEIDPRDVFSGLVPLSEDSEVISVFKPRVRGESGYKDSRVIAEPAPANFCEVILYNVTVLKSDGDEAVKDRANDFSSWWIASINATTTGSAAPETPTSMRRNALALSGGTPRSYSFQEIWDSIGYWDEHAMCAPRVQPKDFLEGLAHDRFPNIVKLMNLFADFQTAKLIVCGRKGHHDNELLHLHLANVASMALHLSVVYKLDEAQTRIVFVAALMHDLGYIDTMGEDEDGEVIFHGHARHSVERARRLLTEYDWGLDQLADVADAFEVERDYPEREAVLLLIEHHDAFLSLSRQDELGNYNALGRLVQRVQGIDNARLLKVLSQADDPPNLVAYDKALEFYEADTARRNREHGQKKAVANILELIGEPKGPKWGFVQKAALAEDMDVEDITEGWVREQLGSL